MTIHDRSSTPTTRMRYPASLLATAVLACLASATPPMLRDAAAAGASPSAGGFCTTAAQQQFAACLFGVRDDLFSTRATCLNVADAAEREQCYAEAVAAQSEGSALCSDQHGARKDLCAALGEARYNPAFDPANFDSDFGHLTHPNRYQPLRAGNQWSYVGGGQTVEVNILDKTKLIEGVACIVVSDRVKTQGRLTEDTDDWFAQAKNGDVYYCGEETAEFENFAGDHPRAPERVNIDGSFKSGRDRARSGIAFLGTPRVGVTYRQEFSAGNAEDAATVVSTHYRYGRQRELDRFVPRAIAQRFCSAGDCVVTAEATPLEPGVIERKYYAVGIGNILVVTPKSGEVVQLVDCNFDARCAGLPMP